jgi:environmental stress-induced protein Ves
VSAHRPSGDDGGSLLAPPRVVALGDVAWQRWRNGRGRTRELLAWPDANAWRVRVSVAEIVEAAPFSAFAGVERWFAVIEGAGVVLRVAQTSHRMAPGAAPIRFDGGEPAQAAPIDGPTRDLNLMVRGGCGTMLQANPDEGWTPAASQAGFYATAPVRWLAELGSGRGRVNLDGQLPAHALLWFERAPQRLRVMAPGGAADAPPRSPGCWLAAAFPRRRRRMMATEPRP